MGIAILPPKAGFAILSLCPWSEVLRALRGLRDVDIGCLLPGTHYSFGALDGIPFGYVRSRLVSLKSDCRE